MQRCLFLDVQKIEPALRLKRKKSNRTMANLILLDINDWILLDLTRAEVLHFYYGGVIGTPIYGVIIGIHRG